MGRNPKPRQPFTSLLKVLDVLELLAETSRSMSISEISRKTGIGMSTVHRILATLMWRDYISQDPKSGRYSLGHKTAQVGLAALRGLSLVDVAMPFMNQLASTVGETVNLGILENHYVLYLAKIDTPRLLKINLRPGTRVPAHCTAMGKAIMAALPEDEVRKYLRDRPTIEKCSPYSKTTPESIVREIQKTKEQRYAIDDMELSEDVRCIAMSIRCRQWPYVAAISIAVPAARYDVPDLISMVQPLFQAAKGIERSLNGMEDHPDNQNASDQRPKLRRSRPAGQLAYRITG